ncbi:MAG: hypothetical protein IPL65_05640 [Lewinellaceae bacterium]|nr:hypothetical protein [Lewinellaceae bacterium]
MRLFLFGTVLGLLGAFAGCQKETSALGNFKEVALPFRTDPTCVWFADSLHGYLTAGYAWEHGELFSSADGGSNWRLDTAVNNVLEAVQGNSAGTVYACGLEGLALVKFPAEHVWNPFRIDYCWNKGLVFPDDSKGVVVSNEGLLRRFGPDAFWQLDTLISFPAALSAVCRSDSNTLHAVGLGWVMRSEDLGLHWERLPVTGDYFRSVCFPDPETGYLCGYSGSVFKSTDGGRHWDCIRKGGAFAPRLQPFRAIYFSDANRGYLAGEQGVFWYTVDGGEHWNAVAGMPADADFTSVFARNEKVWVAAKDGRVFHN